LKRKKGSGGRSFPVLYSEFLPVCWVAFTDVVNFTLMCRSTSSREVISVLNELFSLFDVSAAHYRVEKIKTIGDAFMCAKLSTSELASHVNQYSVEKQVSEDGIDMVMFLCHAIELSQAVMRPTDIAADGAESSVSAADVMQVRAGLHAGPVASGIVGFERPLYDLFGDTVNTAARLEASGRADMIQIMDSTVALFGDRITELDFVDGQTVTQKGLGTCHTRFVAGCNQFESKENRNYRNSIRKVATPTVVDV
jgi:class 3 adenylate cyclase